MHRTVKVGTMNSKPAEVNGEKTKSPLWGGERDVVGKKKTRQTSCLVLVNGVLRANSAEILRPLTSARNYANLSLPKKQMQEVQ